jgi:hypothetical protein
MEGIVGEKTVAYLLQFTLSHMVLSLKQIQQFPAPASSYGVIVSRLPLVPGVTAGQRHHQIFSLQSFKQF